MKISTTLFTIFLLIPTAVFAISADNRVNVTIDTSEAEAVLKILDKLGSGQTPIDADWDKLFATTGYVRLKKRELAMQRSFEDEDFRKFVMSPDLAARRAALAQTLAQWKTADIDEIARLPLAYLPAGASIRATIYPVIKPRDNSFVFEVPENPAIFIYIDPNKSKEVFENTLAHELHHIGFGSGCTSEEPKLDPNVRRAVKWLGAFGEGFAMLAAAGGPNIHPHKYSQAEDRERWDKDVRNFNSDLRKVEKFFLDLSSGKLSDSEELDTARSFYGIQGPWYTVGWKMAVVIEKTLGRQKLIEAMCDQRTLPATYNQAVKKYNKRTGEDLVAWSDELIARLR